MSNYGNAFLLQTSSQIPAPRLWFGSPYSTNVDKHVVYRRLPSSLKRASAHDDEPTDSTVMHTLPMAVVG